MNTYSISEVAKELNLTTYTLRYYDKEGLLPFVERTTNGTRLFKESDIWRIKDHRMSEIYWDAYKGN